MIKRTPVLMKTSTKIVKHFFPLSTLERERCGKLKKKWINLMKSLENAKSLMLLDNQRASLSSAMLLLNLEADNNKERSSSLCLTE